MHTHHTHTTYTLTTHPQCVGVCVWCQCVIHTNWHNTQTHTPHTLTDSTHTTHTPHTHWQHTLSHSHHTQQIHTTHSPGKKWRKIDEKLTKMDKNLFKKGQKWARNGTICYIILLNNTHNSANTHDFMCMSCVWWDDRSCRWDKRLMGIYIPLHTSAQFSYTLYTDINKHKYLAWII